MMIRNFFASIAAEGHVLQDICKLANHNICDCKLFFICYVHFFLLCKAATVRKFVRYPSRLIGEVLSAMSVGLLAPARSGGSAAESLSH